MLKPAILFKDALLPLFAMASFDPNNRFYSEGHWDFDDKIVSSTWSQIQLVSTDKSDNIIGFFDIHINRQRYCARDMKVIRFLKSGKYDLTFAKDLKKFVLLIFDYFKFKKLNFEACVGSPNESMYDKFINRYNGRVVGIKEREYKLMDGTITDLKMYEMLRENFVAAVEKNHGVEALPNWRKTYGEMYNK